MPNVFGNIHTIAAVFEAQNYGFDNCAVIVIGCHSYLTTKYHKGLIFVRMVMDGNFCARLLCIKHTVAQIIKRLMKVVVLAQTRQILACEETSSKSFLSIISIVNNINTNKILSRPS